MPVTVRVERDTPNQPQRQERIEFVCCLRTATILDAVVAATKLIAFWRVDAPQTNALTVDIDRVAVSDAGLAGQIASHQSTRKANKQDKRDSGLQPQFRHPVGYRRFSTVTMDESFAAEQLNDINL
ncbi:hypothetical protein [Bradyrhizobium sp. RD5-C2]|uniref:hypothetical protein n=1 Tax=Bradyrhizobium sp. RD5-C2 TaxID=244562 RepID=UPI0027E4BCA6|nr:hypothetical protein [Bradyrhizobium sp. RD5-C2]